MYDVKLLGRVVQRSLHFQRTCGVLRFSNTVASIKTCLGCDLDRLRHCALTRLVPGSLTAPSDF